MYKTHPELVELFRDDINLLEIQPYIEHSSVAKPPIKKAKIDIPSPDDFSPLGKTLIELLSPESKARMLEELKQDDIKLGEREKQEEEDDMDYTYFENTEVGVFLELWICCNLKCFGCGGMLVKYADVNKPVVDVRCVSVEHKLEHGPKYFQVKSTEGAYFDGKYYFDMNERYIFVGSKKYGYNAHCVKLSQPKDALIGYICIYYNRIGDSRRIRIHLDKSFILLPDLTLLPTPIDEQYYEYQDIGLKKKQLIIFNEKCVKIIKFKKLQDINLDDKFNTIKYIPPNIKTKLTLMKYLKYKIKYLQLKNNIT